MNFILFVLPISTAQTNLFFSPRPYFMGLPQKEWISFANLGHSSGTRCCSIYPFCSTSCHVKTGSTRVLRDSQQQEKENIFTCYSARKSVTQQILKASTALCCNWCTRRLPGKHLAPRPLNCETPVGTRVAMRCSHAPSQCISPLCRCTSYSWIAMCAQQRCPPLPLQEHACICIRAHSSNILHSSMT